MKQVQDDEMGDFLLYIVETQNFASQQQTNLIYKHTDNQNIVRL